jgi:BirA family transcriptional regulator, biotin operon repressor / biotin---[acetyl-CoA-carboxylase] ligase
VRDSLDSDSVSAALVTSGRPWRGVEFHPALGSTNTRLRDLLTAEPRPYAAVPGEPPPGLWWVVTTDHQTGGRGRLGRAWTVPDRASLAVSVAVPVTDREQAGWMPLLAGLALSRAVREVSAAAGHELTPRLKWPNDVLLADDGDRKLSGINVDQTRAELPVDTATSLALSGATVRREVLLVSYLDHLVSVLPGTGPGGGAEATRTAYREACSTIGARVRVHLPGGEAAEGTATAVDDDGALVVSTARGSRSFAAGDVVHVRPAGAGLA